MRKKYYVILSEGEYSDYSPVHYVGDVEITKDEFNKKGIEIGDFVIDEFEKKETYGFYPKAKRWNELMTKWLKSKGYTELFTGDEPEINVSYSEFPCTKKKINNYKYN